MASYPNIYKCPHCGSAVDSRTAVRFVSEAEVDERRKRVLKMNFGRKCKHTFLPGVSACTQCGWIPKDGV